MTRISRADVEWLMKLLVIIEYFRDEFPEEFNNDDDETIKIAGQLIRSLK